MDLKKIQKDIWQNKLNKGFNTTDVNKEFCLCKNFTIFSTLLIRFL